MNNIVSKALKTLIAAGCTSKDVEDLLYALTSPDMFATDFYINYATHPKDTQYIIDPLPPVKPRRRTGIVLQGYVSDMLFLEQTIQLYYKLFQDPIIVISGWMNQDFSQLEDRFGEAIIIVKNEYPETKGFFNLNKMIVSTRNGLRVLRQLGCSFCIRSRVDQRIQYENAEDFLYALVENNPATVGQNRMVILNMLTLKYVPFHFQDMFQFGHIDDLLRYWKVPLSEKYMDQEKYMGICHTIQIKDEQNYDNSEVYMGTQYAMQILDNYQYTYSAYYQLLRDHFIIIDNDALGFLWTKKRQSIDMLITKHAKEKLSQSLTHKDWYLLRHNAIDIDGFEREHDSYLSECRLGVFVE